MSESFEFDLPLGIYRYGVFARLHHIVARMSLTPDLGTRILECKNKHNSGSIVVTASQYIQAEAPYSSILDGATLIYRINSNQRETLEINLTPDRASDLSLPAPRLEAPNNHLNCLNAVSSVDLPRLLALITSGCLSDDECSHLCVRVARKQLFDIGRMLKSTGCLARARNYEAARNITYNNPNIAGFYALLEREDELDSIEHAAAMAPPRRRL